MNRISKSLFVLTIWFAVSLVCCAGNKKEPLTQMGQTAIHSTTTDELVTGAENTAAYFKLLKGKKVGIVTNQTGIVRKKSNAKEHYSLVDFLIDNHINLQKIYAPEHGFRGTADAGEHIKDGKDTKTGLPIISLYGNNKKPKPEHLQGIDVVVFDLQDVGVRFYTYISTLHYVMEACAELNIPLIVLDRPNPNGGIVDGPILEMEHKSFVGMHPIPVLHGMTIGEYAKMINGQKWLKDGVQAELTVIPCLHYKRSMPYDLPVKPSPNLPNAKSVNLYASLCLFEGTPVSVGRGTHKQFQIYGSPDLQNMPFQFTPMPNEGAKKPMHEGKLCFGEDLSNHPDLDRFSLQWVIKAYQNTSQPKTFFEPFFVKLAGTKSLQTQIEAGWTEEQIRKTWQKGLSDFKKMRQPYLIYP